MPGPQREVDAGSFKSSSARLFSFGRVAYLAGLAVMLGGP